MKIEIRLKNYNSLKIKEDILKQIIGLSVPSSDYNSLTTCYKKIQSILKSSDSINLSDFNDFHDIKINLSKKIYDYYLNVQMFHSQVKILICENSANTNSVINYLNTMYVYTDMYKKLIKSKQAEIEEFNTLVKLEKENRTLRKRNDEVEKYLKEKKLNDIDFLDFN